MTEHHYYTDGRGYWVSIGGEPDDIPDGTVEVPLKPGRDYDWDGSQWVHTPPDPSELLAKERAAMSCSPLQGKIALGEEAWSQVEAFVADPETPFAMRIAITSAVEWQRNSQTMDELAWMMGLTNEEVDDLFRAARDIVV